MNLQSVVNAAIQHKNTPLVSRLTDHQLKELRELAEMYRAGKLRGVSWRILADDMRVRWGQDRLQGETLKRNVVRIAHEFKKSSQRGRRK